MIPYDLAESLSPREILCVQHRMAGLQFKEIGDRMGIKEHTASLVFSRARAKARELGYDFQLRIVCCE